MHSKLDSFTRTHTKVLRRDAPHRAASRTSKSRLSALHNDHHQPPPKGSSVLLCILSPVPTTLDSPTMAMTVAAATIALHSLFSNPSPPRLSLIRTRAAATTKNRVTIPPSRPPALSIALRIAAKNRGKVVPRPEQRKTSLIPTFFFPSASIHVTGPRRYLSYSEVSSGWSITWLRLRPLDYFFFSHHRSEATVALGTEREKTEAPTAPSSCPIFFPLLAQASPHLFRAMTYSVAPSPVQSTPVLHLVFAPLCQIHRGEKKHPARII